MSIVRPLAFLFILFAFQLRADFNAGLKAYESGDFATALKEWQPLAEKGAPHAQYNLGLMYARGQGVPQDSAQAANWYRKAAEQGIIEAQYNLGLLYSTGQGVPKDSNEALKWFTKAAEKGDINAANSLGAIYDEGQGGFKSYAEAEKWYRKAADQGIASAQFNLGVMYDIGQGVKVDYSEAEKWYRKAAEQGYAPALCNLAILYYNGEGVKRDLLQSHAYFLLAQKAGEQRASNLIQVTTNKLNKKQIEQASQIAQQWTQSHTAKPITMAPPVEVAADSTKAPVSTAAAKVAPAETLTTRAAPIETKDAGPGVWTGVDRIIAVGDVHGDYEQFIAVLRSANLIDDHNNWTGGKTHLVQTGDITDRGARSRDVLDLLMKLEAQAQAAGGYVHCLIGNHEAMDIYGDLRYVSPGEYELFRDENSEKLRDEFYQHYGNKESREQWNAQHPLGFFEHRAAFAPDGKYGKWLRGHDTVIKINQTLFVHAGLSGKYAQYSISDINNRVRGELADPQKLHGGIVTDLDGPLWYRGVAKGGGEIEPVVNDVLRHFGVRREVIGHSYAYAAITPRFDGRVILIDIGLPRVYDNIGKLGCLLIENDQVYALHRGSRLELPKDEGPDMMRYLKQAAALDPPPSPLQERIAKLAATLPAGK